MNNKYKKKPNGGLKRVTSHTGEFKRELYFTFITFLTQVIFSLQSRDWKVRKSDPLSKVLIYFFYSEEVNAVKTPKMK